MADFDDILALRGIDLPVESTKKSSPFVDDEGEPYATWPPRSARPGLVEALRQLAERPSNHDDLWGDDYDRGDYSSASGYYANSRPRPPTRSDSVLRIPVSDLSVTGEYDQYATRGYLLGVTVGRRQTAHIRHTFSRDVEFFGTSPALVVTFDLIPEAQRLAFSLSWALEEDAQGGGRRFASGSSEQEEFLSEADGDHARLVFPLRNFVPYVRRGQVFIANLSFDNGVASNRGSWARGSWVREPVGITDLYIRL